MGYDRPLVVVKAGDTFPELIREYGDFEDWIIKGLGCDASCCQVVNVEKGEALPGPGGLRGAVISGAHSMVTQDLDWSLALEAWTREMMAEVPLLGICYGHQILARAMGGTVDFHPRGTEIGTREIYCLPACESDPLFKAMPKTFKAHVFHSQSVTQLPDSTVLLAKNEFEPHQAFRAGKAAWGVQFHPEAFAAATRGYILNLADTVRGQGQDPELLIGDLDETPYAAALLKRFGDLVMEG